MVLESWPGPPVFFGPRALSRVTIQVILSFHKSTLFLALKKKLVQKSVVENVSHRKKNSDSILFLIKLSNYLFEIFSDDNGVVPNACFSFRSAVGAIKR